MQHKRTIAVIVGTYQFFFRTDSLLGIVKQAKELGFDVIIFSVFTLTDDRTKHQLGEENIYTLLKNKNIDGYIIVGYTLWAETARNLVLKILSEIEDRNVVLLDDTNNYGYKGYVCDDVSSFENMTDHLIERHGYKKLYCLTGYKGYTASELRLKGFFNSLEKHGIEISDKCWQYGDFWTQAATDLADRIAKNEIDRPEAVICGNDKSALTLVNELIARNVEVPADIAVIGFDFEEDSIYNSPSVTTCKRPTLYAAEMCVCMLYESITGKHVEPVDESRIEFISGESCGCGRDIGFSRGLFGKNTQLENETSLYNVSYMQESMMSCETYDELYSSVFTKMYLIRGIERYALCLNKSWNSFKEDDSDYLREGYESDMFEAVFYDKNEVTRTKLPFDASCIIPENMMTDEPSVFYLNPIHFEDRCFGYAIATFAADDIAPSEVYHSWSTSISVSLEYIRVQERMKLMYDRVFASSIRDAMTGLYNRKGYELYGALAFDTAKENGLPLLVAVADLDGLKTINDTYGHTEGDNAITVLARAIQTCCGNGEYCIRSGGDEFYIIGCYNYEPEITGFYRSRIEGYLSRYNNSSGKPYKVEVSVGFFLGQPESEDIEDCIIVADSNMYADKTARKKRRK